MTRPVSPIGVFVAGRATGAPAGTRRVTLSLLLAGAILAFPAQQKSQASAASPSLSVYQAPNLHWLPSFRAWNYDFFGSHQDAHGRPLDSTDGPVNIVFVGATVDQITRALQPALACAANRCSHPQHMQFRDATTDRPYWVSNGGVRTAATFRCPFDGSAADYHIRLYHGPDTLRWGRTVLGTAHIDCEKSQRFGWHEHAERFIAGILSRKFTVRAGALHLSNARSRSGAPGCTGGTWQYFGLPTWHCMESDGRATLVVMGTGGTRVQAHLPPQCPDRRYVERLAVARAK